LRDIETDLDEHPNAAAAATTNITPRLAMPRSLARLERNG
jgi:hypothetical protein